VIEVRGEATVQETTLALVVGGRPVRGSVHATALDGVELDRAIGETLPPLAMLRDIALRVPSNGAKELKVWVHRTTLDGESEAQPAYIEIRDSEGARQFELTDSNDHVILPLMSGDYDVTITISGAPPAERLTVEPETTRRGRRRAARSVPDRL
jgi:hypothetical protein